MLVSPLEAANHRVETLPKPRFGRVVHIFELGAKASCEPLQGTPNPFEPRSKQQRCVNEAVDRRPGVRLQAITAIGQYRSRQHLPTHQRQKFFKTLLAMPFSNALSPAFPRQEARGSEHVEQRLGAVVVRLDKIADPAP